MFEIQKLNQLLEEQKKIREQLDRIEGMLKQTQYSGAPAQRIFDKQQLMPPMAVTVKKEPKK